jgi:ribulose-5-phosphate 4-epimerase/fuculose-1-phosphate aldolase
MCAQVSSSDTFAGTTCVLQFARIAADEIRSAVSRAMWYEQGQQSPLIIKVYAAVMANCGMMAAGSSTLCKAARSMTHMRHLASMLQASPCQAASLATDACSSAAPVQQATTVNPSLGRSPTAASCIPPADRQLSRFVAFCC